MSEFKIGDVVQLKSGGPEMTITSRDSNAFTGESETNWICTWFEGYKQHSGTFHQDTVEKVEYGGGGYSLG